MVIDEGLHFDCNLFRVGWSCGSHFERRPDVTRKGFWAAEGTFARLCDSKVTCGDFRKTTELRLRLEALLLTQVLNTKGEWQKLWCKLRMRVENTR